jgi:hypothetical protein
MRELLIALQKLYFQINMVLLKEKDVQHTIKNLPHVQKFLTMTSEDSSRTRYIVNSNVLLNLATKAQQLAYLPNLKPSFLSFLNQCESFLSGSFRFEIRLNRDVNASVSKAGSEELLKSQLQAVQLLQ